MKVKITLNYFFCHTNSEFEFYERENNVKFVFCHTHFLAIFSGYQLRFSLNISWKVLKIVVSKNWTMYYFNYDQTLYVSKLHNLVFYAIQLYIKYRIQLHTYLQYCLQTSTTKNLTALSSLTNGLWDWSKKSSKHKAE